MEKTFYVAVKDGKVEEAKNILRKNPSLHVNWKNEGENAMTALFVSCWNGHDSVVSILLAHPAIGPNLKNKSGWTSFMAACFYGSTSCVRLLLQHQRVMVNEPNNNGRTPLYWAVDQGHQDVIKWWVASGREMNLGTPGEYKTDAIGRAKENGKEEVVSLLERFKTDPAMTRRALRVELGLLDEMAAEMFALVVFVSDGLLQINDTTTTPSPAARFFRIATHLPLELQMVLCYRVVGSAKEIISGKNSEAAFKYLAKRI